MAKMATFMECAFTTENNFFNKKKIQWVNSTSGRGEEERIWELRERTFKIIQSNIKGNTD